MQLSNFSVVGLVGSLVFLSGIHLLWKNHELAIAWLREFVLILRGEFARKRGSDLQLPAAGLRAAPSHRPRSGALILVGALALILLGQFLFLLDLTY